MSNYNGQFQDSGANILLPTPHSFANIEGATASQAYIKGQMIVYNNRLCEVISAIMSGDTLTIGTNIAYKNVGEIGKQLVANDGTGFYFDVKDGAYGFYPSASKVPAEFVPFGGSAAYSNAVHANGGRSWVSQGTPITLTSPENLNDCEVLIVQLSYYSNPAVTQIPSDAYNIRDDANIMRLNAYVRVVRYNIDHLASGQVIGYSLIAGDNPSSMDAVIYYN